MGFPEIRMRERRKDEATREKFRETSSVNPKDLVMPVFIKEGISVKKEVKSMPGIFQFPLKEATEHARKVFNSGVPAVILFGIPKYKDELGVGVYDDRGIVQEAIRAIKKKVPRLSVIADVCMCEYTSHGHCGIIKSGNGYRVTGIGKGDSRAPEVDNDATIEILAKAAVSYAKAGVDTVAPSAMMDGQVKAIKEALSKNNYPKAKIMSYSAKYASGFYAPFRDAAESPPQFGDRRTYQMDYHNSDEAVLEARLDIKEGADSVMVKPALGYEDIIYRLKKELNFSALPAGRQVVCYSVSGEYSLIKAAAIKGYLDEKKTVSEILTGFKRAGADTIITYYALEFAKWMKNKKKI